MNIQEAIKNKYSEPEPEHAPVERKTLTVDEVAIYLGLSSDFIYKLVREKRIPNIKIGSRILFLAGSIDKWLSELEQDNYGA